METWGRAFRPALRSTCRGASLAVLADEVGTKSIYGSSPLHFAVVGGNMNTIEFLVEHGADVNDTNDYLETPLHWACKDGSPEIIRYLLQQQADPNVEDSEQNTPLHWAADSNNRAAAQMLLEQGGRPSTLVLNKCGRTPRAEAKFHDSLDVLALLNPSLCGSLLSHVGLVRSNTCSEF